MGGETRRSAPSERDASRGGASDRSGGGGGGTKVCPRCGASLFSDMDVCYGCLYDFTKDHAGESSRWYFGTEGAKGPAPAPDAGEGAEARPAPRGERRGPVPAPASADDLPPWDDDQLWGSLDEVWEEPDDECARAGQTCRVDDPAATTSLDAGKPADRDCHARVTVCSSRLAVRLAVPAAGITIGRDPECDVIVDERVVSRQHVRIRPCGDRLSVQDLGATNPVAVEGNRAKGGTVEGEEPLLPGDRVVLRGTSVSVLVPEGGRCVGAPIE